MTKKKDTTEERIVAVEEGLSKTEQFIENNQKIILIVLGAIIVIVLAYMGYKKYILKPKEIEAQSQMFMAEKYFEQDSLDLAINGDGNYLGFIDIIDEYRVTKSANLANYYLGICYLKKGEFNDAIKYLKKFKSKDQIVAPMAIGAIGDAYMELGDKQKAADYYLEAANKNDNDFISPLFLKKAGQTYEELNKFDKAVEVYKKIQKNYNKSFEAREIEKYIARAEGLMGKK